jgi:pyruvate/2-oxoglutarate dehydrogenase complex dihydrolipoamide dehydrogenase (E3) component
MGGDCLTVGCVPSKCVIRSSRVVGEMRNAATFGIGVPEQYQDRFSGGDATDAQVAGQHQPP